MIAHQGLTQAQRFALLETFFPNVSTIDQPMLDAVDAAFAAGFVAAGGVPPATPAEMFARGDGLYICGDTKQPRALVPLWMQRGRCLPIVIDGSSVLHPHLFLKSWVCFSGPHLAPADYVRRHGPQITMVNK